MTDLTASTPRTVSAREIRISTQIADAVQTYAGGLAALRGPSHATTQGYLALLDDAPGLIPLGGFFSDQTLGATSSSPVPKNNVDVSDKVWRRATVTGAASRGDIGKLVYATDDNVLTLTRPADDSLPMGCVWEWHTSTTCDVFMFGFATLCAIALGGGGGDLIYLGRVDFATLADGNVLASIPLPGHGKILSFFAITDTTLVGTGGTTLLNLEIGGTNLTGGVITLATDPGAAVGYNSAGTAITAANEFHDGDLLDVEAASSGGTRTSGGAGLYITVARELGM